MSFNRILVPFQICWHIVSPKVFPTAFFPKRTAIKSSALLLSFESDHGFPFGTESPIIFLVIEADSPFLVTVVLIALVI